MNALADLAPTTTTMAKGEEAGHKELLSSRLEKRRSVLFGDVQVLEFTLEVGDNPAVSDGCPMALGWDLQKSTEYDLDCYEQYRPPSSRRSGKKLRIPADERTQILLAQGHSLEKIAEMTLATLEIKDSREMRIQNRKMDKLYDALVLTGHKIRKVASLPQFGTFVSNDSTKYVGEGAKGA